MLGHLEEDAAREVAPEDLGVGGGDLATLGYVPCRPHHRQPAVVEVVAGIGRALVVHDRRQWEEAAEEHLVAAGAAGRLEGVRVQHADDAEELVHEQAVRGGEVAEALRRLDDLPAIAALRVRLHGVHQVALLLAQVKDPHGRQDAQRQRIDLLLTRLGVHILGLPPAEVLALRLVLLLVRARLAHRQGALVPAEEARLRQRLVAADAAAQLTLAGGGSRDQGSLPEDQLAGGDVPRGEHAAPGHLRGADGPVGPLLAQIAQVGVNQLRQLLGRGVAAGRHVGHHGGHRGVRLDARRRCWHLDGGGHGQAAELRRTDATRDNSASDDVSAAFAVAAAAAAAAALREWQRQRPRQRQRQQ